MRLREYNIKTLWANSLQLHIIRKHSSTYSICALNFQQSLFANHFFTLSQLKIMVLYGDSSINSPHVNWYQWKSKVHPFHPHPSVIALFLGT